jgi:hypothetical protein
VNADGDTGEPRRGLPLPGFLTRRFEEALRRNAELRVASEVAALSVLREELARKRAECERAIAEVERRAADARARTEARDLGLERPGRRFGPTELSPRQ